MTVERASLAVIDGCAVATVDASGNEYASGHVVLEQGRVVAVGDGPAPPFPGAERIDGHGCLATPALVNGHHHLFQWITRGRAQQATLFEWLVELYPIWSGLDAELEFAAARAGLAALALSGCATTTDHHYLFPRAGGDLLGAEIEAARDIGLRFHPCRGSMDLGKSRGGLPPDEVCEPLDAILTATDDAIARHHDAAFDSMLRIAVAPCSPFSVSADAMRESAALARGRGVRLHTHLAETLDEDSYCREHFGCSPVEYVDGMGWLGDDVWLAHCVHVDRDAAHRIAESGTGVAHCPSSNGRLGSGIAPVADLLDAGTDVGLGVDGAASNEDGGLRTELREALLVARLRGGPAALDVRQALAMGTMGGANCLGRGRELGSLEVGKLADIALWRIDGIGHADIEDPIAALVLGPPPPLERLLVGGRTVVERGELRTAPQDQLARAARAASRELARRYEVRER